MKYKQAEGVRTGNWVRLRGGSDRMMEKFHWQEIHDLCYLTVLLGWKKLRSMKRVGTLTHTEQKKRNGVEDCGLDFFGLK